MTRFRAWGLFAALAAAMAVAQARAAGAQPPDVTAHPAEPESRATLIEQAQAEKSTRTSGGVHLHPFFINAYAGGGFTLGAGYTTHIGSYDTLDVRGSLTPSGYKRIEAEYISPRLLDRRASLSFVGGWREATEVGFYGTGTANSPDDRANYGFKQPYGNATFEIRPRRRVLVVRTGVDISEWQQTPGRGSAQSVEDVYTPETLPGLGASVTYLHSYATLGVDRRAAVDYARRGGFYGVTAHEFHDPDGTFGFTQFDYDAVQHVPLLRETWVLSFHAHVTTTGTKSDQDIPFYMLPSIGGGSSLRGYSSWRFRDRNTLLLQAEWRVIVNRFFDTAVFYDAGKVTAHARDLDLDGLRHDAGFGVRFHGPLSTPLRIDIAQGNEGLHMVWAASASF